jgi:3-oxoacyl-[acyl-carrier-protein] synthase-3
LTRHLGKSVGIIGTGQHYPERTISNHDLSEYLDTDDEWIRSRTGISNRRVADPGTGASELGVPALLQALQNAKVEPNEIDAIIVATVTPDTLFPSTACRIQEKIGATKAFGFDLSAACSGFVFALTTGASMIASGSYQKVAIVGVDIMSSIINPEDRTTAVLFGDGAGAVILSEVAPTFGILDFEQRIDGSGADSLFMSAGGSKRPASLETVKNKEHFAVQLGQDVYKNAVVAMSEYARLMLDRNGLTSDDLKLFIPHQANSRIIEAAAKRLGITENKVMINIDQFANTTAATIPTAIHQAYQSQRIAKGDHVILTAFGAGYTYGSVLMKWVY